MPLVPADRPSPSAGPGCTLLASAQETDGARRLSELASVCVCVSVCVLACCLGASVFCMFLEECVLPILPIPITMVPCG